MIASRRSLVAVVVAAVLGASACTSEPSPNRVAEDLVQTLASTPEQEDCMLEVVDDYDLNELGDDASSENPEVAGPAEEELKSFEADLRACRE